MQALRADDPKRATHPGRPVTPRGGATGARHRRCRGAACPRGRPGIERLVVAFAPGLHVSEAVRAFTRTHPDVEIELLHLPWWEQDAPLRDGRADVGYLRRTFEDTGLRVIPIGSDPKVACLPSSHKLARRSSLSLADLQGESIIDPTRRRVSSVEEKFELVVAGHGIAVVPISVATSYTRPDLIYRPLIDAVPLETCLVAMADRRDQRVADFLTLARTR